MVQAISERFRHHRFDGERAEPLSVHEQLQLKKYLQNLQQHFDAAEPLLIRCLCYSENCGQLNPTESAHLRLNLGKVYLFQGRPVEALAAFKHALDNARRSSDESITAEISRYRLMFEFMQ